MEKTERREVRLTADEDDLLIEAAGLAGVSVSEFVLESAVADAEHLVERHHSIAFGSEESRARFIAALDEPFVPNVTLRNQIQKARRLKTVD